MKSPDNSLDATPDDEGAWAPCPPGEIQGLVGRLQSRDHGQQNLALAKNAAVAAVVTAALVVGVGLLMGPRGDYDPIGCAECIANFDHYGLHLTDGQEMQSPTTDQMQEHLAHCEVCRARFEHEYPGLLSSIEQTLQRTYAALTAWLAPSLA